MKKEIFIAALFLSSLYSFSAAADALDANREAAKKHFIGSSEPSVKDAIWTRPDIFKVGMINDGTSRNGFAEYTCYTLHDFGFKGQKVWVQVIDIIELTRNGKWIKLGEKHCE